MTKVLVLKSFSGEHHHAGRGATIEMDADTALSFHKAGLVRILAHEGVTPTAYETAESAMIGAEKKIIKSKKGKK